MRPARHYSDLIVWQLGEEIRIEVFGLTARRRFDADLKVKSQARDAANSVLEISPRDSAARRMPNSRDFSRSAADRSTRSMTFCTARS
jgi:hypothetical protein